MISRDVYVERLTEYCEEDAVGIGQLMPFLSKRLKDDPIDETILRAIIDSPHHEQLVARMDDMIVGSATMNLLLGPGVGKQGYLEDFVTHQEVRGQGIGRLVWDGMLEWCREQGVDFRFTSSPNRSTAHDFYLRSGAEIRDTTVFHVDVE